MPVSLRDQRPLHRGNLVLGEGWTFEDVVEALNRRVFFWPGTAAGPSDYGERNYARYEGERPAVIRVPTKGLLDSHSATEPLFCRFNSGSPRWTGGRASPRGADTFVPADRFQGGVDEVVEITFGTPVTLPSSTEVGFHPGGPWCPLSTSIAPVS